MQSKISTKMQSHTHANTVIDMQYDSMQNEMHFGMQYSKSDDIPRAYRARPKGDGIPRPNQTNPDRIAEKEVTDAGGFRAPTPTDIDLPNSNVHSESNSISQVFLYDKEDNFSLLENKVMILSSSQAMPNCSQAMYDDDLESVHDFQVDDMQGSPTSIQLLVDVIKGTDEAAPNKKNERTPAASRKEKRVLSVNRVRKRINSRKKNEIMRAQGHIKRPQHQVLGFMEDHAEFGSDWAEASQCRGRYMSSVLESTVDGSIIKGARRVNGSRRMTSTELTSCIDSAIQTGNIDEDPLKTLDDWGLKSELHKYKCSYCEKVSHHRVDIEHHIAESPDTHSEAVVVVLLGNKAQGRNCSLCNVRLHRTEFFKHIREKHKEVFPLRCGYCAFQGQDYNQLRHHIQKKHKTSKYSIIDVFQSQGVKDNLGSNLPSSGLEIISDEEETQEDLSTSQPMACPLCGKILKTLRNLKKHVMQHSRQKKQCNLCSFTTNFPTQIRSHYQRKHPTETPKWKKIVVARGGSDALVEDATPYLQMVSAKYGVRKPKEKKWMRQYRCPHCDYTCNFNSSYNRHLRVHKGVKPFKCGHCNFHGREAYLVSKHSAKVHKGKEIIVEKDKDFKAPYRYAKKIKKGRFEWDELADVDEEEENFIITKPSSYTTVSDVKVEVQTEASLCDVNSLKPKPNNNKSREALMYKCLVISTGLGKDNSVESKRESSHAAIDNGKESAETLSPTISNNNLGNIETSTSKSVICETPLPIIKWDEEEARKQNLNHLLEANFHKIEAIRPHKRVNLDVDSQEIPTYEKYNEDVPGIFVLNNESQNKAAGAKSYASQNNFQVIRVKEFVDSMNSSVECSTGNGKNIEEDRNHSQSSMQPPDDTVVALATTDVISSCIVTEPTSDSLSDIRDESIVIQIYANENGNGTPKEIITYNSNEGLEDSCTLDHKSCKISEIDGSPALKVMASEPFPVEPSETTNTISPPQNALKENSLPELKCYELVKAVKGIEGEQERNTFNVQESSNVPPQGLENTLHNHITFLSDSLTHRLSNRISAPPGVMTRDLLGLDYSNSDYFSSEKVRMMMKKKKGGRVKCLECGVTTTCRAFYKHAKKHFNIKPFKCGYCTYRSIEKSKIRVHNAFCHPNKPCIIWKLSPETAGVDDNASHSLLSKNINSTPKHILETKNCPSEDNETYPSLLKNSTNSELEILNKSFRRENAKTPNSSNAAAGLTSKSALFHCPICSKVLKTHTPSIRRHLYSHYSYKPFKCGYCSFTAIGQTEIRAHHVTHGSVNAPKIEQSGVPMPFGLTQYIDELLSQQRGNKRVNRKKEEGSQSQLKMTKNPTDIMWHEPDVSREELTAMYLSTEDPSRQELVTDDQHGLEALGVEACSLQQSLESVEFNAETTYAVQVLESDRQSSSSFSSDLPSQLDLNVGGNSSSDVNTDPVCVVYLIE